MSIDYNSYDYSRFTTISNLIYERPKQTPVRDVVIERFMEPLITKVALAYPQWSVIAEEGWFNAQRNSVEVKVFRVYEGAERLGTIRKDGWSGDAKYSISNDRIKAAMHRKGDRRTKNLKLALKLIDETFVAPTLTERLSKARGAVSSAVQNSTWRANSTFKQAMEKLHPALGNYITANIDKLRPELAHFGAMISTLDTIPDTFTTLQSARAIEEARKNSTGCTIMLDGDKYVVIYDSEPDRFHHYESNELPDMMRGKLGVLKVVEKEGEPVDSIGMRISPTTFYLLP